jgi:hypothetical protein
MTPIMAKKTTALAAPIQSLCIQCSKEDPLRISTILVMGLASPIEIIMKRI